MKTGPTSGRYPLGRDLDALVAERILGKVKCGSEDTPFNPSGWCDTHLRRYGTDISAAWEVVEAMRRDGWLFAIGDLEDGKWLARFVYKSLTHRDGMAITKSAALSICVAALDAKGVTL